MITTANTAWRPARYSYDTSASRQHAALSVTLDPISSTRLPTIHLDAPVWRAGTAGLDLVPVDIAQHRDRLRDHGLTDDDLTTVVRLTTDRTSGLIVRGYLRHSTIGRRPSTGGHS